MSRCALISVADSSKNPPLIILLISFPSSPPCKTSGTTSIWDASIEIAPCVSAIFPVVVQLLHPISIGNVGIGAGTSARKLLIGNEVLMDCEARLNETAVVVLGVLDGMATA
jgi:hypothetical protein